MPASQDRARIAPDRQSSRRENIHGRSPKPARHDRRGRAEIDGDVPAAFRAIAHGDQPARIREEKECRIGLPRGPSPEPGTHGDTHQKEASPDDGCEQSDGQHSTPGQNAWPDFQGDQLGNSGTNKKIHRQALQKRQALPGRSGSDNEPERHDARRDRESLSQSNDETRPTGFFSHNDSETAAMAGLVPAIHVLSHWPKDVPKTRMPGTRPGTTQGLLP